VGFCENGNEPAGATEGREFVDKLSVLFNFSLRTHNEELHNLYSSPDIIREIKSRIMRWACSTHSRGQKRIQGFGGKA
jgi:hypothetical protein